MDELSGAILKSRLVCIDLRRSGVVSQAAAERLSRDHHQLCWVAINRGHVVHFSRSDEGCCVDASRFSYIPLCQVLRICWKLLVLRCETGAAQEAVGLNKSRRIIIQDYLNCRQILCSGLPGPL